MHPKVSIVVPIYKVEKYLQQCIDSLFNQSLKEIEIILIDDGSPDHCPEMCDKYALLDKRVKVIHKKNEGLGFACNSGIDIAKGEFIAFLDSDDYIDKDMYLSMYNIATINNCDVVYTGLKRVDVNGTLLGYMQHPKEFQMLEKKDSIHDLLRDLIASKPNIKAERSMQVSAKVALYSMKLIKENKLRFVSERQYPSEDLIFNIDILSKSQRVCILPHFFYNYRINPKSITNEIKTDNFMLLKRLHSELYKRCEILKIEGDILNRISRMFIGYTRSEICKIINSKLSIKEKRRLVASICNDDSWNTIWDSYPVKSMPFGHKIFSYSMQYKEYFFMWILAKFRK